MHFFTPRQGVANSNDAHKTCRVCSLLMRLFPTPCPSYRPRKSFEFATARATGGAPSSSVTINPAGCRMVALCGTFVANHSLVCAILGSWFGTLLFLPSGSSCRPHRSQSDASDGAPQRYVIAGLGERRTVALSRGFGVRALSIEKIRSSVLTPVFSSLWALVQPP